MDTPQWAQGNNNNNNNIEFIKQMNGTNVTNTKVLERRTRPTKEQALNCPRCNSTNTKFCYYNNYSLTQPRYFCKTCRRYWTEGGSLRNVPVGGGSRKNKTSVSSPSSSISKTLNSDLINTNFPKSDSQNPKIHQGQDLNLAYPPQSQTEDNHNHNNGNGNGNSSSSLTVPAISAMELLKSGIAAAGSRGLNSFMSATQPVISFDDFSRNNSIGSIDFHNLHDFNKVGVNFSVEGFDNCGGGSGGGGGARLLFPVMEEMKQQQQVSNSGGGEFDEENRKHQGGDSTLFWNGMLGGGSW